MVDGRKLHKRDLLDISSSVGMIAYPRVELVDFATRTALRFLNVALKSGGEISEGMATSLVKGFPRRKVHVSLSEASLILRTMAEFLRSPKPIHDWRGWPTLYANFLWNSFSHQRPCSMLKWN
jgi:hypothetical protein